MALFGLLSDPPEYQNVNISTPASYVTPPSAQDTSALSQYNTQAFRSPSDFKNEANRNLDQANLLGPEDNQTAEQQALNARAMQMYKTNMNQMLSQGARIGTERQTGLQSQALQNQAAQTANSRENRETAWQTNYTLERTAWEQQSYQRQSELQRAVMMRQLYGSLFKGSAAFGGAALGTAMFNAKNPSPVEGGLRTPGSDVSDYTSLPNTYQPGSNVADYR